MARYTYDPTAPGCVRNTNTGATYVQHPDKYLLLSMGEGLPRVRAHRVVWELHHGAIPEGMQIDHINQLKHDNRIENLRLASPSENNANKVAYSNSKSGVKGLVFHQNGWCGQVRWRGTVHTFRSKDRALVEQWLHTTRSNLHEEFACHEAPTGGTQAT